MTIMKRKLLSLLATTFYLASPFAFATNAEAERSEANRLGFGSVQEMKEIHSRGWHTKERFLKDNPNSQLTTFGDSEASKKEKSTHQSFAAQVAGKWNNNDFIECTATAIKTKSVVSASGNFTANQLNDLENSIKLFDFALNIKIKDGQLTRQQFQAQLAQFTEQIPHGNTAKNGRTPEWYSNCLENSLTISRVAKGEINPYDVTIKETVSHEQLASKISPLDAARCGIVFSYSSALMLNSKNFEVANMTMWLMQATNYVLENAISRGEPRQLYENAQKAHAQEMETASQTDIANQFGACSKSFLPLFFSLEVAGLAKRN